MKYYLSSVGVPDVAAFKALFKTAAPRIGLIPDAWHVVPKTVSEPYITRTRRQLEAAGAQVSEVILADGNIAAKLQQLDGIWVMGGNTFYLAWAAQQAGLGRALKALPNNFVYGGESAGAVLAGTTLRGIEFLDNPAEAPETLWDGLSLVHFGIIPHWDEPGDEAELAKTKAEMQKFTQVKTLTNDEFLVQ